MAFRILVVDDEPLIVKGLRYSLEQDGFVVDDAYDGEEALEKILTGSFDLVLLDCMLPKLSGMDILKQVRDKLDTPVIMLTAKGDDIDKILGLEYGADDYIVKPFNVLEVKARIRTVLRRTAKKAKKTTVIKLKDIELDVTTRTVKRADTEIYLTAKEFNLLHILMANPLKVFSREDLLQELWNADTAQIDAQLELRTVDVHIRRLREKLEKDPAHPEYIMTKWGVGYYFEDR